MEQNHTFDVYALAAEYRKRDPKTLTREEKNIINVAEATFMDDIFMSEVFRDDKEGVAYLLNIILERSDLTVEQVATQHDIDSAFKRSIRLDIRAVDADGKVYDIEIQRSNEGAIPQRARFYSAKLDHDLLEKDDDFGKLADTYVIFITDKDIYGHGLPVYKIERRIVNDGFRDFADGAYIYYVNGSYREPNDLGCLMHDFHCNKAEDMYSALLARRMTAVKENAERSIHMGLNSQDFYREGLKIGREEGISLGVEKGRSEEQKKIVFSIFSTDLYSNEAIAKMTSLPLSDIEQFAREYASEHAREHAQENAGVFAGE
ncbi:MAG: PD-(D/E)XK nuclease family transposase [Clostridia bacterium]|nr:PD-(D/E)XK nuclease family transposase [Clostridia bacterium]